LIYDIKSDSEYIKSIEENAKLKFENENLKKDLDDKKEDHERIKFQFQEIIKKQTELIKKGDLELIEKKMTIEEISSRLNQSYETFKKFDIEKTKLDSKINELTKENKSLLTKVDNLQQALDDKTKMVITYQESLIRHENESSSLAMKLAQLKTAVKSNYLYNLDD